MNNKKINFLFFINKKNMRFSRHEDNEVTMRALLNSVEAGIMIGKGGSTIAHARTLGVKAGVSKQMEASDDDRVVTISGPLSKVVQVSPIIADNRTITNKTIGFYVFIRTSCS